MPDDFGISARLGSGRHFVIEADEYDTAFFDKRSKFVHYRPRTAVLNNLEYDHADIFENLAAIEKQFHHLVRTMPEKGLVVVNGRCEALDRVLKMGCWSRTEFFDREGGWTVDDARNVSFAGNPVGQLEMALPGLHNALNATAAIAAARDAGVDPKAALEALSHFAGVKRRLEVKGEVRGVTVIDDFAHHPTAIRETIAALRQKVGSQRRIFAVLEPRSNTMKLGTMKAQLAGALAGAERVFCWAGDAVHWDTHEALLPLGEKAETFRGDMTPMIEDICRRARAGDVILCMSNGSFGGIHAKLLKELAATAQKA